MKSFKQFNVLVLLLLSSCGIIAQDKESIKRDGYSLTITNKTSPLATPQKETLIKAFFNTYPAFAHADGYQTKREVDMEISDDFKGSVKAAEGTVVINRSWFDKNGKHLEKVLQQKLAENWVSVDTINREGYSLVFINKDPNLNLVLKKQLIETYFKVYPVLVKTYNHTSTRNVLFVVDPAYKAVAEASGGRIMFSADYLKANPTDIDVVTHETMHVVQGYGQHAGPGWLTEGIADYIRYKHGVDNVGSKWSLPAFVPEHHYTNSYRITARFFAWVEKTQKPGLIKTLDAQLRSHTFSDESWKTLTGKTLDELWGAYIANPVI